MGPERKVQLLGLLERTLTADEAMLKDIEEARNNADSAKTSRYDGQREIFAGDANLKRKQIDQMRAFQQFVSTATPMDRIHEGAEFTVELWDEGEIIPNAIYTPLAVKLGETTIITPNSPMGAAIRGLKAGDAFTYEVRKNIMAGQIKEVK